MKAAAPNLLSAQNCTKLCHSPTMTKSGMIAAAAYHGGMPQKRSEESTGALVAGAPQGHLAVAPRLTVDPIQHLHRVLLTGKNRAGRPTLEDECVALLLFSVAVCILLYTRQNRVQRSTSKAECVALLLFSTRYCTTICASIPSNIFALLEGTFPAPSCSILRSTSPSQRGRYLPHLHYDACGRLHFNRVKRSALYYLVDWRQNLCTRKQSRRPTSCSEVAPALCRHERGRAVNRHR